MGKVEGAASATQAAWKAQSTAGIGGYLMIFGIRPMAAGSVVLIAGLISLGCAAPATRMNRIGLGMKKADVFKALGEPISVSAIDGTEILNYRFNEGADYLWHGITHPYYVAIASGAVKAYGRAGDFMQHPRQAPVQIMQINQPPR